MTERQAGEVGVSARPWAGPLAPWLLAPGVTDVLVHAPGAAWIDRGRGLERVAVDLATAGAVRALATRLAAAGGARLDDASPVADARLPDGTRLHAVLPPVAPECTAISLRIVRERALTLEDLEANGALDRVMRQVCAALVARRASLLVTGSTGSGKTTLMAALLSAASSAERIVVIEEAGEIMPHHAHVVRLVERRANIEGAGAIVLAQLVREALRMRPDRVVLGECRGVEIRDVLAAFNTGHPGSMTTLHANAPAQVPTRLATLGALVGMPERAVHAQALAAFDVVLHVERREEGRWLSQVAVLVGRSDGGLDVVPALTRHRGGSLAGPGIMALAQLVGEGAVAGAAGAMGDATRHGAVRRAG
ncbi:TadA family conjugal transfer-associated ATPase [Demequina sp. NBRC 110053]|uniref:TadA family conjugal transfer-associated ATPase n=1 Tax=Demequina sp. NBRC 110053 TaxID=1570342 RepID=UPI001F468355|nr:TadA family conjugal transfer-associated ATPase [Demequina sp. NBRC 110053]